MTFELHWHTALRVSEPIGNPPSTVCLASELFGAAESHGRGLVTAILMLLAISHVLVRRVGCPEPNSQSPRHSLWWHACAVSPPVTPVTRQPAGPQTAPSRFQVRGLQSIRRLLSVVRECVCLCLCVSRVWHSDQQGKPLFPLPRPPLGFPPAQGEVASRKRVRRHARHMCPRRCAPATAAVVSLSTHHPLSSVPTPSDDVAT